MDTKYIELNTKELRKNPWNPNEMTQKMGEHLVGEIERVGFLQPILINKNNLIIDGEHRWLAAKELLLEKVPCIQIDVDDKMAKTLTINMNKIKGEVNPLKLAKLLEELKLDYEMPDLENILKMDISEIDAYGALEDLPDYDPEDIRTEQSTKTFVCPSCGHSFQG